MHRYFLLFVIITLFLPGCDNESNNNIVFINGRIWTADDKNPYAEAVAIKDDMIVAVGTTETVRELINEDTIVINLQGKRLVPGFQDSHTHFLAKSLTADPSFENIYIPEYPDYNETESNLRYNIIGLEHIALKALGLIPTDLITDIAFPFQILDIDRIKFGMRELSKMGITTIFETGADWKHYELAAQLRDSGELKVRMQIYLTSRLLDELINSGINRKDGDEWLRIIGVKFYADGWLGPRTCALRENYSDKKFLWQLDPDYRGVLFFDQDRADCDILKAHRAGLKIATHVIGDRAVEVILNSYENALKEIPKQDHRHTLEHVSLTGPDLIQRIKELKVIPSIQLSFATSDMHFAEEAFGAERSNYAYAWKSLLNNDIICAGGSDFPNETISPLWGIQRIVTREEINSGPTGGWHPEQRISVEEALRLITINSAYNSFEEDIKGSIEAGKLADMVVLSRDILEIPANEISDTKVELTMVGGEIVYILPGSIFDH